MYEWLDNCCLRPERLAYTLYSSDPSVQQQIARSSSDGQPTLMDMGLVPAALLRLRWLGDGGLDGEAELKGQGLSSGQAPGSPPAGVSYFREEVMMRPDGKESGKDLGVVYPAGRSLNPSGALPVSSSSPAPVNMEEENSSESKEAPDKILPGNPVKKKSSTPKWLKI